MLSKLYDNRQNELRDSKSICFVVQRLERVELKLKRIEAVSPFSGGLQSHPHHFIMEAKKKSSLPSYHQFIVLFFFEINPECSLEGLMLNLKLQYFGYLMQRADSLKKSLMLVKIEGKRRRGRPRMKWLDSITDSMEMNLSKP